ncbi:MAG: ComF family protein [Candidatus Azotimanducaceae bacterium]|jgi:ComF family protein
MNDWLEGLQFRLFPGSCILCGNNTGRRIDLCKPCEEDLPRTEHPCWQCGLSIPSHQELCGRCLTKPPFFSHCYAAFKYTAPIDILINRFKNQSHLVTGKVLSIVLAKNYVNDHIIFPDFWLPVPLHKDRLKQRGFNQSFEIATFLSDHTRRPICSRLCRRIKQTTDQKTLSAFERATNIKQAFVIDGSLKGESIGIVDDVITTTATVSELARILREHGAGDIQVVALARTPADSKRH